MTPTLDAVSFKNQNTSLPLWLKIDRNSIAEAVGFFPSSWLVDAETDREGVLIRLDPLDISNFNSMALDELRKMGQQNDHFTFLIRRSSGYADAITLGPTVESFACTLLLAKQYILSPGAARTNIPYVDRVLPLSLDISAYELSVFMLDYVTPTPSLRCVQLPYIAPKLTSADERVEWIIPPSSSYRFMDNCCNSIDRIAGPSDEITFVLDEANKDYQDIAAKYIRFRSCITSNTEASIYATMNTLIESASAKFVFLQEPDGTACIDRRIQQSAMLVSSDFDIIGCNEIRIDEMYERVQAIRFPSIVAQGSIKAIYQNAINLSNCAIRRSTLQAHSGIWENLASDIQFFYRAMLKDMRIGNVDEYLIVSRRYENCAAMHLELSKRTPKNIEILRKWTLDYQLWQRGELALEAVSFI